MELLIALFFLLLSFFAGMVGANIKKLTVSEEVRKETESLAKRLNAVRGQINDASSTAARIRNGYDTMLQDLQEEVKQASGYYSEQIRMKVNDRLLEIEDLVRILSSGTEKNLASSIKKLFQEYDEQLTRKAKQIVLNDFFGEEPEEDYARSDEFEKQQFESQQAKREGELDFREMKQELREGQFAQDQKIHKVTEELTAMKSYVTEKFAQVEVNTVKELSAVKELLGKLRIEVKEDMSDIKVQFGKEIVRLDKQQLDIIGKLQEYGNLLARYKIESQQLKIEAERLALSGQDMFNRANILNQLTRVRVQKLSNDLKTELQQISLHKQEFANDVGRAKLSLDSAVKDIEYGLKDMAYERIGINALREQYEQRTTLAQEKIQNLNNERLRIEERIRDRIARNEEASSLQHRLYMTKESLQHASNRADLMRQEFNMVRRLTK